MKINMKVRLKNKVFWATFLPALIAFIYTTCGCLGIVPAVSQEMTLNLVATVLTFLAAVGVLNDPTTKGLDDSKRSMGYTEPN